jgi:hypothetical protein
VRRALVLLLGLSVLGLGVAAANSFSSNSEDLTTFTTDVSISVPSSFLPPVIYVSGDGTLELVEPPNHHTSTKDIILDSVSLESQADPARYITFASPPAPTGGFVLQGFVKLFIDQNRPGTNRMTAALLDCPASEPDASTGCTTIVLAVADPLNQGGNGFKERVVNFGSVTYTIPQGNELRLKIVNRAQQPIGTPVSSQDWTLQYGFLPARESRLTISATP